MNEKGRRTGVAAAEGPGRAAERRAPGEALRLETGPEGIAELVLDVPGEKVNLLSADVMRRLDALLDEVRRLPGVRALLVRSGKPDGFVAGADIHEFQAAPDAAAATALSSRGQAIFDKLEDLPFPTVAVVRGPALGGGAELTLACGYRLLADERRTRIAFPEVKLGVLPGLGGTWRLPRLIGLPNALEMILTGKEVVARQALSRGLADLLAPAGLLDEAARRFARELAGDHAAPERVRERRRRRVAWTQRLLSGPLSGITFALAQRSIGRAGRFYPAPLEILALVRRTLKLPRAEALQLEAEAFGRLAATPVSKNLVRVFFVTEALKKAPAPAPAPGRIAVLGAGVMGAGLAAVALERGMSVRLRDVETRFLAAGAKRIHEHLAGRVRRRRMEPREMEQALARLGPTTELTGFGSLELVLEAAIEDLAVKQRIFREVEERVPDTTVLATNTSSLRVSDLARALRAPERFVGIHFFNPPDRMPLVELVRGEATSAETLARALAFARALGKYPVIVQDRPGFLVNRVLFPYLGEAVLLVEQGNGIRDVDRAALDFGMPMGPLRVLDEVGLDVAVRAARSLEAAYPGRAGGSGLLSRMVERGWLGRKSGRGFYVYRGRRVSPNSGVPALGTRGAPVPDAQDRLVRALRDEAARALSEGVVGTVEELDAALILGAGFPPFRGGVSLLPDFRAG